MPANPSSERRFEYRVVWKRRGKHRKSKRFASLKAAERRVRLLGPEPWTAFDRDPDEPWCCRGYECGCGGVTVKEYCMAQRESTMGPDDNGMPAIESIHIERRPLAKWESLS